MTHLSGEPGKGGKQAKPDQYERNELGEDGEKETGKVLTKISVSA
jgi:hypothetical protein